MKRTNVAVWLEKYNRWQIKVQKDNIRKTFTSSTPGRNGQRECHRKADAWLDDNITDSRKSVDDMVKEYINKLELISSKSQLIQQKQYLNNWIVPKIGKVRMEKLTEQHLQSILDTAYSKGLSKKTLNNIRACINAWLKFCRTSKATMLIAEDLSVPKGAKYKGKTILTPDDLKKLFNISTILYYGKEVEELYINAYRLQVLTGLRPGEVIGLKWSDIQGNKILLSRSINVYNEVTDGKNENAKRAIFLTPRAKNVLEQQKERGHGSEHVFCDRYGDVSKQTTYYKHWKAYCEHNKITETTPYELRHTFVSVVKEMPEGYLKQIVGHSASMDTYGIYGHQMAGDGEAYTSMIQDIFEDILKEEEK